jgi:hypothetical protein
MTTKQRDTFWYFDESVLRHIKIKVLPDNKQSVDLERRLVLVRVHEATRGSYDWFSVPRSRVCPTKKAALKAAHDGLLHEYRDVSMQYAELEKRMNKIESLLLKAEA